VDAGRGSTVPKVRQQRLEPSYHGLSRQGHVDDLRVTSWMLVVSVGWLPETWEEMKRSQQGPVEFRGSASVPASEVLRARVAVLGDLGQVALGPLGSGSARSEAEDLRLVAGSLAQSGQQIEQECPNGADRVVADAFDDPERESGLFDRNERDRIVQHPVGGHQAAVLQLMQRHDHGVVVEFGEARIDVANRHQPHFRHRVAEQHEQRRRKIVVERHRNRFARAHRLRRR